MPTGTPRARPMAQASADGAGPSPRGTKPSSDGKPKAKAKKPKGSAPTAPVSLGMPMSRPDELTEAQAKSDLEALQKKYGALIVNFNNQQAELAAAQERCMRYESEAEYLRSQISGPADDAGAAVQQQLKAALDDLRAVEAQNMALQKKVNKLQVEHVSEEEVDQLFYALEVKEAQLEQAQKDAVKLGKEKSDLEEEVMTARQLTARGGNLVNQEAKFVEIHHHNDMSDDDSDSDSDAKPASAPAVAVS